MRGPGCGVHASMLASYCTCTVQYNVHCSDAGLSGVEGGGRVVQELDVQYMYMYSASVREIGHHFLKFTHAGEMRA